MPEFRFHCPIEIRYGDLDPQGHVNNARYLTYMEQARIAYLRNLGFWHEGQSFLDIGVILAEAQVTFLTPIQFHQKIRIGVCISRLGNKSIRMEYRLEEIGSGMALATGSTVLVAYDYHTHQTVPIPDEWRKKIDAFETLEENHGRNT